MGVFHTQKEASGIFVHGLWSYYFSLPLGVLDFCHASLPPWGPIEQYELLPAAPVNRIPSVCFMASGVIVRLRALCVGFG